MKFKRIAALAVALAMGFNMLTVGAFAADATATAETATVAVETTPEPTAESTAEPTAESTAEPTAESTAEPTAEPVAEDSLALLQADPATLSLVDQLKQRELLLAMDGVATIAEDDAITETVVMAAGDATDPYLISNADQLKELAGLVNAGTAPFTTASYKLVADIDLSAVCGAGNNWTPIGIDGKPFWGSFDGNGKTVAGLYINAGSADYQGLFGYVAGTGTIKNLGVTGANVTAKENAGILVGKVGAVEANTVAIENCYTTGTITGENLIGGVVGYSVCGTITGCYNTAAVTATAERGSAGGVIAYASSDIKNSYNTGAITGLLKAKVGGIVGVLYGTTVESCFSTGTVTGGAGSKVGGIASTMNSKPTANATVTNCVALNQSVTASEQGANSLFGAVVAGGITETTTANAYWGDMTVTENGVNVTPKDKYSSTALTYDATAKTIKAGAADFTWPGFDAASWDNVAAATLPTLKNAGGSQSSTIPWYMASAGDTIEISTAAELQAFAAAVNAGDNFSGKTVKLTADIDLSSVCSRAGGESWTPIGNVSGKIFSGTFDGQNHTVSNLYISGNPQFAGLFGRSKGTIKNLGVVNASISTSAASAYVGAVVAQTANPAVIENCYSTGSVETTYGSNVYVGGVAGAITDTTAKNCYSSVSVTAPNKSFIGGVVGYLCDSSIDSCYSTGKISGSTAAGSATGGIVGSAVKAGVAPPSVTNCVALNPSVSGANKALGITQTGAVVGYYFSATSATITGNSYWGGMTVKINGEPATSKDQSSSTPLTYNTDEAKLKAGTADFAWPGFAADTWETVTASTLPTLKDIPGQSSALPAYLKGVTPSDEILISTAAELETFAMAVRGGETYENKTVKLTADIDLSSIANWKAIGTAEHPFSGTFDGQNHTISNLKINKSVDNPDAKNEQGLFGRVTDGTIKNLYMLNANVKAGGATSMAGAIVGYATGNTTIDHCYTTGNIEVTGATISAAGGIAGALATFDADSGKTLTVKNCYSTAKVTTTGSMTSEAGGIAGGLGISGSANTATIANCYSTGEIKATSTPISTRSYAGGITGSAAGIDGNTVTVSNCLGLNPGVGAHYYGAVVGSTQGTVNTTGNAYWSGMIVRNKDGNEQFLKDDTFATALSLQDGYLNDGNAKLDWTTMGFAANGWVAPTEKQLLPCFTGTTTNLPAMPLDAASQFTLAVGGTNPSVAMGSAATITAKTTGTGTSLAYQWYTNNAEIAGATAASYTTPANLAVGTHTYLLRVIAYDANNADRSMTVYHNYTVTVTAGPGPTPTVVPGPTATVIPGPTVVPGPTNVPVPTNAPVPTYVPVPTGAPAPSAATGSAATNDKFTVNAWVNVLAGGTISPMGVATYTQGQNVTYTITPATGYRIARVTVDGVDVGAVSSYTFKGLNRSHAIGVYFEKGNGTAGSKIPQTADEAPLVLWVAMMSLAAVGLGATVVARRKKQN